MSASEEQRAAAYRANQLARAEATALRVAGLAGDPVARAALQAAWAPILAASGPLVPVARGMLADADDMTPGEGYEPDMPFTEQLA